LSAFGGFATPGQGAAVFTTEREIVAQGFDANQLVFKSAIISGATRDAGNTPTTVLRPGLLLGRLDSGSEYEEWDADAADGTQNIGAVLWKELRAQDFDANNTDRAFTVLVGRGVLQASKLLIQGSALIGHVDEYLARRQLAAANFQLDDDPFGYKAGQGNRMETVTGTTDTLTADQNGMTLLYNNAASVTVTLPAILAGLAYDLIRAADEEFIVVSPTADNVIVGNDLSADGVTFTTASEQIGAHVRVESIYLGTTLKWLMTLPPHPFGTGTATETYAINT
jgi:hypothetical protein